MATQSMSFSIYGEYKKFVEKYKSEYASSDVLVLMQVGSFYEVYSANDGLINIHEIANMLNVTLTKKNKTISEISESNCYMLGFPQHSLPKYVQMLLQNNYTVVIVNQKADEKGAITRYVEDIVSPGTMVENLSSHENNYLFCIFVEELTDWRSHNYILNVGASYIDLSTGECFVLESSSRSGDKFYGLDEIYRHLISVSPKEIFIIGDVKSKDITQEWLCQYLELNGKCVHDYLGKYDKEITNVHYQTQFLEKVFNPDGMLSVIEYLDLEKHPCALTSFVALLQFAYKHSEHIIEKIKKPTMICDDQKVVLSYNTTKQLNLLPSTYSQGSLLDILNNCRTSIGKRRFRDVLMNPSKNIDYLEKQYEMIEKLCNGEDYQNIRIELEGICDMQRQNRRIVIGKIHPFELISMRISLRQVLNILKYDIVKYWNGKDTICNAIDIVIKATDVLNETIATRYNRDNITQNIFQHDYDSELDKQQEKCNMNKLWLEEFIDALNKMSGISTAFKTEYNEKDGFSMSITVKRFETFLKDNKNNYICVSGDRIPIKSLTSKRVSSSSSSCKISHPLWEQKNNMLIVEKSKLQNMISKVFSRFLVSLYNINKDIEKICNFIGEIDIVTTNAFNAIKYKYCRPSISKIATKSFVKAKGIRHAIIEMIQNKTEYVCNDISLGCKGCDGLLLYGINASGKSSLMKSVGISVIMASAGMYVPCEEFEFYPYDSIFTRIPTGDNMFKGESTFTNEISELRKIIQYANRNSLVIGDELCSGTESVSAMSIVASGILELCYRGTSFIFATHLHDLVNLNKVKTLDNLRVCHLKVTYDEKTNSLIYDRKLADGQGATLYGLEVCKSLNLPKSFLETADSIRKEIMEMSPTLLGYKRSRYNNSLFKDKCGLCDTEKVEEVHHIVEQHTADENGFVDHRHKNHLSNLVGLCKECHQKVHDGIIKINGYKQTSSGIRLMYGVENF